MIHVVKLMNVITSFTSLFTIVVRLIAIQVLHSYLQAQLGYNVERNLFRCVQVYKYGICYDIYYISTFHIVIYYL